MFKNSRSQIVTGFAHRGGFTLIELLVVISIIALLISILLPTLKEAKRTGLLLTCTNNLKSFGISLTGYATENNNAYPAEGIIWGLYSANFNADPRYDYREFFIEWGGGNTDILFCPLESAPHANQVEQGCPMDEYFLYAGCERAAVHYIPYFIMDDAYFNWSQSGNPDLDGDGQADGPYEPLESTAVVMADENGTRPGQGDWRYPQFPAHGEINGANFRDSNSLYADGHAKTTGGRCEGMVSRGDVFFSY